MCCSIASSGVSPSSVTTTRAPRPAPVSLMRAGYHRPRPPAAVRGDPARCYARSPMTLLGWLVAHHVVVDRSSASSRRGFSARRAGPAAADRERVRLAARHPVRPVPRHPPLRRLRRAQVPAPRAVEVAAPAEARAGRRGVAGAPRDDRGPSPGSTTASRAYEAFLREIRGAKRSIRIVTFVVGNDATGRALLEALAERPRRGSRSGS